LPHRQLSARPAFRGDARAPHAGMQKDAHLDFCLVWRARSPSCSTRGGGAEGGDTVVQRGTATLEQPVGQGVRGRDILARRDLLTFLECSTSTCGARISRLVSADAPLDRIYHGSPSARAAVEPARRTFLWWISSRHDPPLEAGWAPRSHPALDQGERPHLRQGRKLCCGLGVALGMAVERDGSVTTLASHYGESASTARTDIVVRSDVRSISPIHPARSTTSHGLRRNRSSYLDFQGVFRISPDGAKLDAVITDTVYPNGLASRRTSPCST